MPGVGLIDTVSSSAPADGSASASKQDDQIAQLADILVEVTGAAKDTSVQAVTAAVTALGGGGTIAQVVALLTTDATTQASILAKLTEIGVDVDASASSLSTLVAQTDSLESLIGTTNTKLGEEIDVVTLHTADAAEPVPPILLQLAAFRRTRI